MAPSEPASKPASESRCSARDLEPRDIAPRDRLILALDVEGPLPAKDLVEQLGDAVEFYKVGLQLLMAGGCFGLIDWLVHEKGKKVFADFKLHDIPQTVQSAVRRLNGHGVSFTTVHAGSDRMLEAACDARGAGLRILAVTVLTSSSEVDLLRDLRVRVDVASLVLSRAGRAVEAGCDGVVASGAEGAALRERLGRNVLIVMPGIRPEGDAGVRGDDQKRVAGVREAFAAGADYIVVGRPIRQAPDPRDKAEQIQGQIAAALEP